MADHGACGLRLGFVCLGLSLCSGGAFAEPMGADLPTARVSFPTPSLSGAAPFNVDPWEPFNRPIYAFNLRLDHWVVAPLVQGYVHLTPRPVRRILNNALANLREPRITLNELLQGHPRRASVAASRFLVNSSIGVLGAFDPAARWGLAFRTADFGQTLGRYGVAPGPFLYLPLIGPIDVRDGVGRLIDAAADPISVAVGGVTTAFGAARLSASAVDARATLGPQLEELGSEATDPYAAIRSVYTQRRNALVRQSTGDTEVLPDFNGEPEPPAEQNIRAPIPEVELPLT